MAVVSRLLRGSRLSDPLTLRFQQANWFFASCYHANYKTGLEGASWSECRGFGSSAVSGLRPVFVTNRSAEAPGEDPCGRWSRRFVFSRALCSAAKFIRPVSPSSPWRIFQRDLFLKSFPEHAALQYLEAPDEGVVVISLNRSEARNAIGAEMLKQLHGILGGMRHSTQARVLLVLSTVPGVFCAGADLKERRKMGVSETEKFVGSLRSTFSALEALPIPTIAVVEGAALGGGLELALACDLRVCGDEAIFGLPETSLAIIPGAGGTQRLPRVIGRSRAKELIFTARRIDAQRAEAIGLVDHCVQAGEAYEKAIGIAREIISQGPLAVQVAKHAVDHGSEMDQAKGMLFEEACYSRLLNSRDRLEGLAAFAEKRKPVYHGE